MQSLTLKMITQMVEKMIQISLFKEMVKERAMEATIGYVR
jgi:hypothetical protein